MKTQCELPKITRSQRVRIVTSGYTDRWLTSDTTIEITIGDPITTGYKITFNEERYAIRYLQSQHGTDWDTAYQAVHSSTRTSMSWRSRGVRSSISDVSQIDRVLSILNSSTKPEIRAEYAESINLTAEEYYALCTGLYECNESNRRLAHAGLRADMKIIVQPDGFEPDSEYNPEIIKRVLENLSIDPSQCYFTVNHNDCITDIQQ